MQPSELRAQPRVPFGDKISLIASSSAPPLRVWASNLAEGGLCLITNHPFRRGDRVGVRLKCLGTDVSVPVSEVAWVVRNTENSSRAPAVGLRFLDISANDRKLIRQWVKTQNAAPEAAVPPAPPPPTIDQGKLAMHQEPSLPPLGAPISTIPSISPQPETTPPSDIRELMGPSLGPIPSEDVKWEFSDGGPSNRPSLAPKSQPNLGLAAGLLVAGTLTGMIFGVLNQSARPTPPPPPIAAAPGTPEADLTPLPPPAEKAAEPVIAAPTPAPIVAEPAPAPKPAPVIAKPTPAPAPAATTKGFAIGAITAKGNTLVLPLKGTRKVERHFALKSPDRVVLDLATDPYDGPSELKGKGPITKIRVGNRPGGVRLVLDVKNPKLAQSYKVQGSSGNVSVIVASR